MLKVLTQDIIGKPKAVIFDTDNTLYPYEMSHSAAMDAVKKKSKSVLGVTEKEFENAFKVARKEIKLQLGETASSHSRLLYFQKTIESLALRTRILITLDLEQTYWRTYLTNTKLFSYVREFILELKSNGILMANITDLTAQIQFRKMVYFGLDEHFDYVVTSEEAGHDKPDPRPFQIALDKLKIDPEETWMIGDSASADMAGANLFGIKKIQKIHKNVVIGQGDAKPDIVFSEYASLSNYLKKIVNSND